MKDKRIQKIRELERKLNERCISEGLKMITGFTVMYDDENGHTIGYVKGMTKRELNPNMMDKKATEQYTGFVIGNMLGWRPISPKEIVKLLEKNDYKIEDFTEKHTKQFAYKYT